MRKIKYLFAFLTFMIFTTCVNAASVNITSSSNSVTVGNNVTVYVTYYGNGNLVTCEGTVSYDKSKLSLVGGDDLAINYDDSSNSNKAKTFTYTFKALSSGSASVTVIGARILDMSSDNWITPSVSSKTLTLNKQKVIDPATYSKDNNLKSLSINGYTLSPDFDKDTLEYSIDIDAGVESIIIDAVKNDSTATITGNGEVKVEEGLNKIEIKVTAQNGNIKTYIINANVKEYDPIKVTVDNKEYTVVRKKDNIIKPNDYFEESTVNINDNEVPCFYNSELKYYLVGLKDTDGNVNLFIYKDGNYLPYKQIVSGKITLLLLEPSDLFENYKEYSIEIDNEKFDVYKISETSKFALVYGINLNNNTKDYYMYDQKEGTLQRYNIEETTILKNKLKKQTKYFYLSSLLTLLFAIISIITLISKLKSSKNVEKKINETKKDIDKKLEKLNNKDMASLEKTTKIDLSSINLLKEEIEDTKAINKIDENIDNDNLINDHELSLENNDDTITKEIVIEQEIVIESNTDDLKNEEPKKNKKRKNIK